MYRKKKRIDQLLDEYNQVQEWGSCLDCGDDAFCGTRNMTKAIHLAVTMKTVRTIGPQKLQRTKRMYLIGLHGHYLNIVKWQKAPASAKASMKIRM